MASHRGLKAAFLVSLTTVVVLIIMARTAAADTDVYLGVAFHPFTLDDGNDSCIGYVDDDIGPTRNCDPVNLVFPGRTWQEVYDLLSDDGWEEVLFGGSNQGLYFGGTEPNVQDMQLFKPGTLLGPRYHIRLWQTPGETLVTFAAVHHEDVVHNIDMPWEEAEAYVASALCSPDCQQTGALEVQSEIQGEGEEWRGLRNDGSATVIPGPTTPTPTATATASDTPTATATNTPTATSTNTPTATSTATDIPTATNTPTNTPVPPTHTPTPTATDTVVPPTNTPTATSTPTNTPVPSTNTPTATASNTPTATPTFPPTSTSTAIATATGTSTATATGTMTATASNTPTATGTNTPTPTSTRTPTSTPTNMPSPTPTGTPVPTATGTPTLTPPSLEPMMYLPLVAGGKTA